jgi:pyroglutamyl-peptidase
MLRRRHKSPKPDKHAPQGAPRSRRRARPDTPVPVELMLPAGGIEAPPEAPKERPRRQREHPPREQPAPPQEQAAAAPVQQSTLEPFSGARESHGPQPAAGQETHGRPQPAAAQEAAPPLPAQPGPPVQRGRRQERPSRPPRGREPQPAAVQRPPVDEPEPPRVREPRPAGRERSVLVTGFECFGGERINPSWEICNRLPRTLGGYRVETVRVPCEFRRAIEVVAEAIERYQPVLVLCLGQAGGRTHVSVERVAINVDDASIEDNGGMRPIDEPIALNGPAAYFATLPVKAMAAAMREARVPAEVSNSAGTYVCNHLMYGVLHYLAGTDNEARAGFVHVPYAEEQVLDKPGKPAIAIATMARGIEAAIAAALMHERDIATAEGKLD